MTVESLISTVTPPLKDTDTVEFALGLLLEFRVRHLPVMDHDRKLLGILSEDQLLDSEGPDVIISTLLRGEPVSISSSDHIFEATGLMIDHDLTTVPVTSDEGDYIGLIQRQNLFEWYARTLGTQRPGAIISLDIEERDYSLSRLIHAIEQTDTRVHSVSTEPTDHESGLVKVTIKLNTPDAARVRSTLEHNGYHVSGSYGTSEEDLTERIQEFMRYLEV
jgi:acetoin utilization protein AcuB